MSTASGTNDYHGRLYGVRGTDALNAAPFFYNADPNIPDAYKVPSQHRYTAGGAFGGPILKNKLFAFLSYQHVHNSDEEIGSSRNIETPGLTDDRSPAAIAALVNGNFPASATVLPVVGTAAGDINPMAYGLLHYNLPTRQFLAP